MPPERLADYVDEFRRIVAAHGVRASFTGHASAGCMHVRPMLDLKTAAGVGRLEAIAREVGRLVAERHGAFSGRARRRLLALVVQPGAVRPRALRRVRGPQGPVRPAAPAHAGPQGRGTAGSREPALRRGLPRPLRLAAAALVRSRGRVRPGRRALLRRRPVQEAGGHDVPAGGGLAQRVAHDSGARQPAAGGRRRRCAALPDRREREFEDVLGTCLACKACSAECPAAVDMAALKVEWLAEVNARHGTPLLARAVADLRTLSSLAAPVAPLVNALGRGPLARALMPLVGVDPRRSAPAIARRSLSSRQRSRGRPPSGGHRRRGGAAPDVIVFADCFIEHQEPHIGEALLAPLAGGRPDAQGRERRLLRTHDAVGRHDRQGAPRRAGDGPRARAACPGRSCRSSSSSRAARPWCATTGSGCCPATATSPRSPRRRARRSLRWPTPPPTAGCASRGGGARRGPSALPRARGVRASTTRCARCAACPTSSSRCSTPAAAACRACSAIARSATS